ncbi:MAG: PASTA domain-containing protein [Bacteroidetes bacterium]|nr:PASTA domain-containing protein [Bacteroidota bacterium]
MRNIFLFIKSTRFRIHFIISLVAGFVILWVSFKSLNIFTHHGIAITVPDFSNIKTEDIGKFIADKQLRFEVVDSVFDSKVAAGVVIKQDPEKNSSVKQKRIIYLTVSAKMPPLVKMPNLVDASMRQALALIESYGLKAGKREYRADPCVNCVLAQIIKGKKVEAGTMIPKGSIIDVVIGKGEGDEKINIPCMIGLPHKDALDKIAENGLSQGAVICNDCKTSADKENAKVYKQIPDCSSDMINPGNAIDLYLSIKTKAIPPTSDATDEK